jgi:hypothetical protein
VSGFEVARAIGMPVRMVGKNRKAVCQFVVGNAAAAGDLLWGTEAPCDRPVPEVEQTP